MHLGALMIENWANCNLVRAFEADCALGCIVESDCAKFT